MSAYSDETNDMSLRILAERVNYSLNYNKSTGLFTRVNDYGRYKSGDVAGTPCKNEYISIGLGGRRYKAHRLAWLVTYGRWPAADIDHIDGNRQNNAIANLREATRTENLANCKTRKDNLSGLKGVHLTRNRKYAASITSKGLTYHLGTFANAVEAHRAYAAKAVELSGTFARLS